MKQALLEVARKNMRAGVALVTGNRLTTHDPAFPAEASNSFFDKISAPS
ncbi:MAG: hypothetical protein ABGX47_23610 [Martelella sp.]